MKSSRQRCDRLPGRAALLFAAALVPACAGDPPFEVDASRSDEGRVELGSSSLAERDYDARARLNAGFKVDESAARSRLTGRFASSDISASFDQATGVTRTLMSRTSFLTEARAGGPEAIARDFVTTHAGVLGLSAQDVAGMELTDSVYSRQTGVTHLYYSQRHLGLPVYNAQLQFNVAKDGRILSVNNSFVPGIAALAQTKTPSLRPEDAVLAAAGNLSLSLASRPESVTAIARGDRTLIDAPELSRELILTQLMWLPVNAKQVSLVWRFQVDTLDGNHWFDYTVDADDGAVWTRFDMTDSDSYRAYKEPVESANHSSPPQPADGRVVIVDPADPTASPLGWHSDGTTNFTIHRGNNVHAYDDRDANNQPPATQPDCGAAHNCDFPINFAANPSTYTPAAVSNLFYWNNLIHDVMYQYGFDEVGGNFQVNNFGLGGAGNDAVRAEAQDGAGTNNANFATPADGSPPRMQMFEWTLTNPRRDGDVDNGIIVHEYGHGISNRLVGGPSNVNCLNNAQQGGEGWSDWFGLWLTAEPGDAGTDPRGIGTYALGEPVTGPGIRTQQYSTDPEVNDHTYESIQGMAIPHGVGEVWAQGIWEVYWALVDQHGYDADIYNADGTAGNQRALLYVIEGLKNTACSPTFTDARDGIIAAATSAHGGEDVCLLWQTFAGFGLGTDAVSGGPNSTNPTNGFSIPAECQCSPQPVADAGPDQVICAGDSASIGTPAVPGNSYSWAPGGETTAEITVTPAETTTYTVTASTSCGTATDSVTVTVDDGNGGGFLDDFETGATGWTATGLWHLANNSTCATPGYSSPTHAFYYGRDATCNYNTGGANTGDLTSPTIQGITPSSTLTFDFFRRVERFNGSFDRTQVDIIRSNGTAVNVFNLDSRTPSNPASWRSSGDISLAQFAGDTIQLRFRFNTVDGVSNNFTGWLIDDVSVTTASECLLP